MEEIIEQWEKLLEATSIKTVQLSQAWQQEKFNLGVDNMSVWMEEVENILSSQDFGADLAAVEQLIKEHTLLEQDVRTHQDIVDIIVTAAQQFTECGHFDLKTILQRKVRYGESNHLFLLTHMVMIEIVMENLIFKYATVFGDRSF